MCGPGPLVRLPRAFSAQDFGQWGTAPCHFLTLHNWGCCGGAGLQEQENHKGTIVLGQTQALSLPSERPAALVIPRHVYRVVGTRCPLVSDGVCLLRLLG